MEKCIPIETVRATLRSHNAMSIVRIRQWYSCNSCDLCSMNHLTDRSGHVPQPIVHASSHQNNPINSCTAAPAPFHIRSTLLRPFTDLFLSAPTLYCSSSPPWSPLANITSSPSSSSLCHCSIEDQSAA